MSRRPSSGMGANGEDASALARARRRATLLLKIKDRSESDLRSRLERAGFAPEVAAAVVGEFRRARLVDDARLARSIVDRLADHGDAAIADKLGRAGIAGAEAREAMAGLPDEAVRADHAARALLGRMPGGAGDARRRRLYAALLRRGFDEGDASDAVERHVPR